MARRQTNVKKIPLAQRATSEAAERRNRWIKEAIPVLMAKDFADPEKDSDPEPMAGLHGEAERAIEELASQIHRCCSEYCRHLNGTTSRHRYIQNAVSYAKFYKRSHDAVIRVYDEAGNVIEDAPARGRFHGWSLS